MTRNEFKKEAAEAIIDCLEDGYTGYLCELHNEVFNYGYYETSKYIAADWFNDYEDGVFDVIEEIKNYEQDNFGEVTTDFSDASKVLNMFWYIIGEEVLGELMEGSADCDDLWNEELTEEENKLVLKIFEERMEDMGCYSNSQYEDLLERLADLTLDEGFLKRFNIPKKDTIYKCEGPFRFIEYEEEEEDDEYWEDPYDE